MPQTPYRNLAERAGRLFTQRYLIALAAVGVLSLLGQILVQWALMTQAHDARVINLAGRQRMLSQQLVKSVLACDHLTRAEAAVLREETRTVLGVWARTNRGLQEGDRELNLPPNTSPTVRRQWEALAPHFTTLHHDIEAHLDGNGGDLRPLLANQQRYLDAQESLVWALDRESGERVVFLQWLELALFVIVILTLIAEVMLVFRPAVAQIQDAIRAWGEAEQRALEAHIAEAAGRMQRHIGQDLHDGLGQELTGISFQAKALQRQLGTHPAVAQVTEILTQLQASIAQTRSLARLLNPPAAEPEGLGSAMRDLADNTARAYGLACECAWDDDLPLPTTDDGTPAGVHLYRIAQEAIANAARHGRATRIAVLGHVDAAEVLLEIEDNGSGFDPAQTTGGGMGLRTMTFRAARLGAQLTILPLPGAGMRVRVAWKRSATGPARA